MCASIVLTLVIVIYSTGVKMLFDLSPYFILCYG